MDEAILKVFAKPAPRSIFLRPPIPPAGRRHGSLRKAKFDPAGNSQLIENVEQIFFHRVFAEPKFVGHFAITKSIRDQGHDLLLAGCEYD